MENESKIENNTLSTKLRRKIYFLVRRMMSTTRNFEIELFNKENLKTDGPVIYSVNHSNCHDVPTISEISDEHFFLLAGVQNLRIVDKIAFFLLGSIYVDRKNRESKKIAKEQMVDLVSKGNNLLIFPEGTWNVTPNKLLLPLNWGIIDIAKVTGATIKPINLEYINEKCYINVGNDIKVAQTDTKEEKIEELKEAMATLKWETLEMQGIFSRTSITEKDFECYTIDRFGEYKNLNTQYERDIIRKDGDTEEDVFKHFGYIQLNANNAFLAKSQYSYMEKYHDEVKRR